MCLLSDPEPQRACRLGVPAESSPTGPQGRRADQRNHVEQCQQRKGATAKPRSVASARVFVAMDDGTPVNGATRSTRDTAVAARLDCARGNSIVSDQGSPSGRKPGSTCLAPVLG